VFAMKSVKALEVVGWLDSIDEMQQGASLSSLAAAKLVAREGSSSIRRIRRDADVSHRYLHKRPRRMTVGVKMRLIKAENSPSQKMLDAVCKHS
jgi:hypothetical protein